MRWITIIIFQAFMVLNFINYLILLITKRTSLSWAIILFICLLAAGLTAVKTTGLQGRLHNWVRVITGLGLFIGLLNLSTVLIFTTAYAWIMSIPPGDLVSATDLQNLAEMLLLAPVGLVGLGFLSIMYFIKTRPSDKTLADYGLPRFLKPKPSAGDNFPLVLCQDKKTGRNVIVPHQDLFRHLLVLGPTGCGKTSLFLAPAVSQLLQNPGNSLLIIDPKGDFAHYTGAMCRCYDRSFLLFDPTLPDCPVFNPLSGREDEVVENLVTTLESLADEKVRYFLDQNARLLRSGIRLLKRLYGDNANLLLLNDLLHNRDGFGFRCLADLNRITTEQQHLTKPDMQRQNREIISYFRDEYFSPQAKTFEHTSGVRTQISNLSDNIHLRRALNPPPGHQPDIDFDRLLQCGGVLCISLAQGQLRNLARYLGLFLQMSYQSAVFRRPFPAEARPPAFEIIDEVQVIANEQFAEMVQQARSLGCSVIAATQGLEQLALHLGISGRPFLAALKTNFLNRVIFAGLAPEDARLISDWSGLKSEQKLTKGISRPVFDLSGGLNQHRGPVKSRTVTEQEKPVFTADEVIYLKAREVIYFVSRHMQLERPRIGIVRWLPDSLHRKVQGLAEITLHQAAEQHPTIDAALPGQQLPPSGSYETADELLN